MRKPERRYRLQGLEPDNLLAFLTLLGLLRVLDFARPTWHSRAAWDLDAPPLRPVLILAVSATTMEISEAAAEGAAALAANYTFPRGPEDKAPQSDLNYTKRTARVLLLQAAEGEDRDSADVWSALMCNVAEKDDKIDATPLCLLFGQGHQHFLDRLATVPRTEAPPPRGRGKKALTLTAGETLYEALFESWTRQDPTAAFRWDPAEDVRYALRADDPSRQKSTTQHGANRLAALGLPMLTVTPARRGSRVRLQVLGGAFERGEFVFSWPIWDESASLAGIRALLAHPDLAKGDAALGHFGVVEVRRTRRISVGKFMNFTRAEPIRITTERL
jgi:hypothetical protein